MPALFRLKDAAARLSVSRNWLRGQAKAGLIPAVWVAGGWRFRVEALERWLREQECSGAESPRQ